MSARLSTKVIPKPKPLIRRPHTHPPDLTPIQTMPIIKHMVTTVVSALKARARRVGVEDCGVDLAFISEIDRNVVMLMMLRPVSEAGVLHVEASMRIVRDPSGSTDQPEIIRVSPWESDPPTQPGQNLFTSYQKLFDTTVLGEEYLWVGDEDEDEYDYMDKAADLERVADFQGDKVCVRHFMVSGNLGRLAINQ